MTKRPAPAPTAPVLDARLNIARGHEISAWARAKEMKAGDGPTAPRRFSWEATP